jgi:hypothetical protein
MNALQKIKLSKELLATTASLKGGQLKALEKIKASKRALEIVGLLGGTSAFGKAFVEFEPDGKLEANILPDEKERLAAKYPILTEFISEMKKQDFVLNASIGWGGASAVFDNTVGERVEISLNVVKSRSDTSTAGKIAIQQYKSSGYEYYGIFEVSTSGIQDAIKAARAMLQPATNPLYQSVLDGAAVTIDLAKQVRAEGQKDPDHPQLRPAVRVIVEAVKAMAA